MTQRYEHPEIREAQNELIERLLAIIEDWAARDQLNTILRRVHAALNRLEEAQFQSTRAKH